MFHILFSETPLWTAPPESESRHLPSQVPPFASRNKTLPLLVGRRHKDPQAHAQVRDQNCAPDGSHFGDIRPKCHIQMRRMQDFPHEPQDQIIANNCGQSNKEKAHSFTRFEPSWTLERPISVKEETIERTTSVGNGIG